MKAKDINVGEVSALLHAELSGYLGEGFIIAGVTSELLPGPDG